MTAEHVISSHGEFPDLLLDHHTQYLLLAGRAGGQTAIGGTLTGQNLILQDNVADANTITLTQTGLVPSSALDLGTLVNPFQTLYIDGNVSNIVIEVPDALATGGVTNYIMELGGGFYAPTLGGGDFTFRMSSAVSGGENICTFDLGAVWFAGGAGVSNDFVLQCHNGLDMHRFIAKFGGWTNPEYGWALDRITYTGEGFSKTLFFDNQEPVSDVLRSIDFRINTVNVLTIENDLTVDFPLQRITAPGGLIVNSYANLNSQTVFNLYDILNVTAVNTNAGAIVAVKPMGTSVVAATLTTNDPTTTDYGTLENSIAGSIARLATWRLATGTGVTEFRIGEMASAFFGIGILDSLTTIDFYFAGAIEMQLQPDTLIFNNGAIDTQIDWSVNGQLGLQVATNDILRLTATQVQIPSDAISLIFGAGLDASFIYDGTDFLIDVSLQNPSDLKIDCGTEKTIELVEPVWDDINVGGLTLQGPPGQQPDIEEILDEGGGATGIYTYGIDVGEAVSGVFELLHWYKEGTDVEPHIHFSINDAPSGTDYVKFELTYTFTRFGETVDASTTISIELPVDTQYMEYLFDFPDITGTALGIGDQFQFTIERVAAAGAAFGGDILIKTFGLHCLKDTMGSRQEYVK